ncbi:MAG: Ig-like domain-containing protein [Bacteroidota bacterium]|nr:Ig-like domain-containing protein [Bacteroidota bacterium]
MKTKQLLLTFFSLLVAFSISASVTVLPTNPNVQYIGRFNKTNPLAPIMTWTGTAIRINFQGTSLQAKLSSWGTTYDNITIDGVTTMLTLQSSGSSVTYPLCSGLSDGIHTATIFKRDQPWQPQTFYGFVLDDGKTLVAPPDRKVRKIEFYGDSQTQGAQVEVPGNGADMTSGNYDNNYYSYAAITARALNAEYTCVARNGATLTPITGRQNIPDVYDRVGIDNTTPIWDFSWIGDVICVDLGVNDSPFPADFTARYVTFVQKIRANHPNAYIFLLAGPLWNSDALKNAIQATATTFNTAGDSKVYYYAFSTPITHSGHPRTAENVACAKELVTKIKSVIWSETLANLSVEDVYITPIPTSLTVGGTEQLVATVSPFDAVDKVVSWSSSNESVLKVSSTGLVTAIGGGTATITATSHGGNKAFSVSITASSPNGLLSPNDKKVSILLFPNPLVGGILNINSTGLIGEKTLSIMDITGKLAFSKKLENSELQAVNLSNANLKGSYIARISNAEFSISQLLLIQ